MLQKDVLLRGFFIGCRDFLSAAETPDKIESSIPVTAAILIKTGSMDLRRFVLNLIE
jgi:hypothetical protein